MYSGNAFNTIIELCYYLPVYCGILYPQDKLSRRRNGSAYRGEGKGVREGGRPRRSGQSQDRHVPPTKLRVGAFANAAAPVG